MQNTDRMKNSLYLLLLLPIFFSSCHIMDLPYTRTPSGPYVQTKEGKKFTGSSANKSLGIFARDKIILGDTSFLSRDVAFYSTGGETYANIGRRSFAKQVAYGKINLYRLISQNTSSSTSYNGMGGSTTTTSTHNSISYYIQPEEGAPLESLKYKHLLPLVEQNSPEGKMLEKFRRKRVVTRILGYGSLGAIVTGFAIAAASPGTGAALVGIGLFVTLPTYMVKLIVNKNRLLQTVLLADKGDPKKAYHEEVGKEKHKAVDNKQPVDNKKPANNYLLPTTGW